MLVQSCRDDRQLTGFQLLALSYASTSAESGIIDGIGYNFSVFNEDNLFYIAPGMLIDKGMIVENHDIENINLIMPTPTGTQYLVIENDRGTGESTVKFKVNTDLRYDNFINEPDGVNDYTLATVNYENNVITNVYTYDKYLPMPMSLISDLQHRVGELEAKNKSVVLYNGNLPTNSRLPITLATLRKFRIIRVIVGDANNIIDCPMTPDCTRVQGMTSYLTQGQRVDNVVIDDFTTATCRYNHGRLQHTQSGNHGATTSLNCLRVEGIY